MGQLIFPHGNSKKKSNLKITIMKRSFFALLAAAVSGLASCQQDGTQDDAALPMNVYSFDATTEGTRVSLDHTALTYTWDGSEQVMVWYAPAASAPDYDYTLIGDPFVAESAGAKTAFSLRTEYDLSEMGYDDQNYVLMYPWPYAGTSGVSGDEVTYTIGTREGDGYVQKDVFEGIYNLMRAETTGSSLLVGRPPVTFEHLLTSLRFYVKESAEPAFDDIRITDMEILFPENVIGETKVNFRKGYVASASSRKVIVDLDAPLTPQKSYKDESGEANDDQYALVVVKPFTLKANTDGNANDRILVTLRGTGTDIHTGEAERITQTLVLTSDSDMEFEAGHFRAVSLQLENDWTPVDVQLTEAFAPAGDYAHGVGIMFDKRGECFGFHASIKDAADKERMIVLDNTSNRWSLGTSWLYAQSAFYMPSSTVLKGYTQGDIAVTFDAHVVFSGKDKNPCPIIIGFNHCSTRTNGDTGDGGFVALASVDAEPALMTAKENGGYPEDAAYWRSYEVVIPAETIAGIDQFMEPNKDGSAAHMGFKLDGGGLLGQSDTKGRMVYIKNICFSYENK